MTADSPNLTGGTKDKGGASEAALIATFYGRRDETPIQRLHNYLFRSTAAAPEDNAAPPDRWENPAEETIGRRFNPPGRAAHDTTVIQLVLNTPGNASEAWQTMRQNLESILEARDLAGIWGYTLVYQAVLNPGITAGMARDVGMRAIRRLHLPEDLQPLAQSRVSDNSQVWLLGIPDEGNVWTAGTVYVALGPSEEEETLLDTFYGPAATMLAPDTIAHKGYYQMRQYRGGDLERKYEENLKRLQETTDELLKDLARRDVKGHRLEALFVMYARLLPVVSALKDLHIGLLEQSENYRWWQTQTTSDVVQFHYHQLETAASELKLKVEPLQYALDMADRTVSVAQVQVDRKQEERQQEVEQAQENRQRRLEFILAVVAAALALPQLMDREVTRALLAPLAPVPTGGVQQTGSDTLILVGMQFFMVLIFAILFGLAASWLLGNRRKRQD